MRRNIIGAGVGALALAGTVLLVPLPAAAGGWGSPGPTPARWLPPCQGEDGPGPCFWNAGKRGNHKGISYVLDRDGAVYLRQESRRESACKDAASEGDPARIPTRFAICEKRAAGYKRWPRPIDGHSPCFVKVGPTSRVWCTDGYRTTS